MNKYNRFIHFMNEKNAEGEVISVWWFFILVIIGIGIVLGVMIYYSAETVIKDVEAESLNQRIFDCLIINGQLNQRIFENTFDIFESCGLNKEVFGEGSLFYFKVSVYNGKDLINEKSYGASFEKDCYISKKISTKRYPLCFSKNMSVLNDEGKELKLVVLTASNQEGERVSVV